MLPGKGIDYPKFFLLYAKLNKKKRRIKELRSSKHIKLQTAVLSSHMSHLYVIALMHAFRYILLGPKQGV